MGRAQVLSFLLWANGMVWISAPTLRVRHGIEVEHVGVLAAGRAALQGAAP